MSVNYSVNCSIMFPDVPLLERPAVAKAAGFDAIEFWWPFSEAVPPDSEVDEFVAAVRNAGVQLVGLNFFAGDRSAGERGIVSWPRRGKEFRQSVEVAVAIGEELGVRGFNALYGNRIDGFGAELQDAVAAENLALASAHAHTIGAMVLLEPVSGAPHYPLKTAADVIGVISRLEQFHVTGVGLLADLYHLAVNGDDVDAVLSGYRNRIGHVQIADAPGRGEPGTGGLPIGRWLEDLHTAGYLGWVGLEYKPAGADPFAWLPERDRPSLSIR